MAAPVDDLTGSLNLISHGNELETYNNLVARFRGFIRLLCTIMEMECMSEYDYILEVYDGAVCLGQSVINNEFPMATTDEEFAAIIAKMEQSVSHLEAVERVLQTCFINNFIKFE